MGFPLERPGTRLVQYGNMLSDAHFDIGMVNRYWMADTVAKPDGIR